MLLWRFNRFEFQYKLHDHQTQKGVQSHHFNSTNMNSHYYTETEVKYMHTAGGRMLPFALLQQLLYGVIIQINKITYQVDSTLINWDTQLIDIRAPCKKKDKYVSLHVYVLYAVVLYCICTVCT